MVESRKFGQWLPMPRVGIPHMILTGLVLALDTVTLLGVRTSTFLQTGMGTPSQTAIALCYASIVITEAIWGMVLAAYIQKMGVWQEAALIQYARESERNQRPIVIQQLASLPYDRSRVGIPTAVTVFLTMAVTAFATGSFYPLIGEERIGVAVDIAVAAAAIPLAVEIRLANEARKARLLTETHVDMLVSRKKRRDFYVGSIERRLYSSPSRGRDPRYHAVLTAMFALWLFVMFLA
ncbi:MAG: hypothetical protein ACTSVT_05520 [Candidatus Thorarchaeota archaeon]